MCVCVCVFVCVCVCVCVYVCIIFIYFTFIAVLTTHGEFFFISFFLCQGKYKDGGTVVVLDTLEWRVRQVCACERACAHALLPKCGCLRTCAIQLLLVCFYYEFILRAY